MRKTIPIDEMEKLGDGGWLSLYRFKTAVPHPVQMAARNNGRFYAAKCLLLSTESEHEIVEGAVTEDFCATLYEIGLENVFVTFLAADRPITYFEGLDFSENYQLEITGGVVEADESQRLAALREAVEEGGLSHGVEGFIQSTSLLVHPCPWDAGSHAEAYSIETAIVRGTPNPPAKEGVDPAKCARVPLLEAQQYLLDQRAKGVCVEGYALSALWALCSELHGWWQALTLHNMLADVGLYLRKVDDVQSLVGREVCYQYRWHDFDDQASRNFSDEWTGRIGRVEVIGGRINLYPEKGTGSVDSITIYRRLGRTCVRHKNFLGMCSQRGLMERYGRVLDARIY